MNNKLKIFSGRSNPDLALKLLILQCELGKYQKNVLWWWAVGKIWGKYQGCDVFNSVDERPAENILKIVLMADAVRVADRVSVIPYFGYGRQDRKINQGSNIKSYDWYNHNYGSG